MIEMGALFLLACGTSGAEEPAAATAAAPASASWAKGEVPSFRARYASRGEASKGHELTGTLSVGPDAVRLDLDYYPNAEHAVSFVRVHGETDLWQIDPVAKTYTRALSGDWTHQLVPRVVDERGIAQAVEGGCPFGRVSKPEDCVKTGAATVAGEAVETWVFKRRTIAVSPTLRTGLREEYAPFLKNPGTQVVELADLARGAQDPALFKMPADYTCEAGMFCEDAPK